MNICVECGNDEVCEGETWCSECLHQDHANLYELGPRPVAAAVHRETPHWH